MKLIGRKFVFGLSAAAVAVACSSGHESTPGSASTGPTTGTAQDGIGAIGMALTLPGGEHISLLKYTLANATNTYQGSYNVANTTTPSFTIGSVAAGTGYQLTLSATSDDGLSTCSFPSAGTTNTQNLSVVNRTTTVVNVNLQCVVNQGLDAGSVLVNGTTSNCPVWNTIVANPENITLNMGANVNSSGDAGSTAFFPGTTGVSAGISDGQQLVLVGSATGPNPGALAFNWSTTGGTLSSVTGTNDPNSTDAGTTNQTIFTCPSAPTPTATYTVTLALSDGADASGCDTKFTTGTVTIVCSNPAPCGGAPFASSLGGVCDVNGTTTPAGNDPAGFPYVTTGATDPSVPADFCCAGACGDGTVGSLATTFPSGTGGCASPLVNNGGGCCVPLEPCTVAGQLNCVQCQGNDTAPNANKTCTPTEAALVQHDIAKGHVTAPGADSAASCYTCLFNGGCLDDTHFGDTNHECEDSLITHGTGTQCETTLACILGTECASSAVSTCYCGTAGLLTTCQGNPASGPINGACDAQIAAGLGFAVTDGTDVTAQLTSTNFASGMADQIFQCAQTNHCAACQD